MRHSLCSQHRCGYQYAGTGVQSCLLSIFNCYMQVHPCYAGTAVLGYRKPRSPARWASACLVLHVVVYRAFISIMSLLVIC
jgi:hypothetical protein